MLPRRLAVSTRRLAVRAAPRVHVAARPRHFAAERDGAKWAVGSAESQARPPMENIERIRFYKWLEGADWAGPVGLTAKFTIAEEQVESFLDIMKEQIAVTRTEAGMLQYDLVSEYDPSLAASKGKAVFFLLERFATRQALLLHVESAHYKRCQERFLTETGGHPLVQLCFYRIDPINPPQATCGTCGGRGKVRGWFGFVDFSCDACDGRDRQ